MAGVRLLQKVVPVKDDEVPTVLRAFLAFFFVRTSMGFLFLPFLKAEESKSVVPSGVRDDEIPTVLRAFLAFFFAWRRRGLNWICLED